MSQRVNGFKGGVQANTSATSVESASLDRAVREASKLFHDRYEWRSGYSAFALRSLLGSSLTISGAYPDGGVFVADDGSPLLVIEAKRQGLGGNAVERWYKNYMLMQRLGCPLYLTFCTGEGFFNGNSAERIINQAVAMEGGPSSYWNTPIDADVWFYRYDDTVVDVKKNIVEVIETAILEAVKRKSF